MVIVGLNVNVLVIVGLNVGVDALAFTAKSIMKAMIINESMCFTKYPIRDAL